MIRILEGSSACRWGACLRAGREAETSVWLQPRPVRRPWEGLRQLVFQWENQVGHDPVRDVLETRSAAASLVLPGITTRSAEQARRRWEIQARLDSHLSHNRILQRPFVRDWVDLLAGLSRLGESLLLVPEMDRLDAETMGLLHTFFRQRPEAFPRAVVGIGTAPETRDQDERGIAWGPYQMVLSSFLFSLGRHGESERVTVREGDASEDEIGAIRRRVEQDDEEDGRLLDSFSRHATPCNAELSQAMLDLVQRAFSGYAFEAAQLWGLRLLERQPELSPAATARLHGLVALSGHNRQFHSRGNETLAGTLETHLRAALDLEPRDAAKSAPAYRLAVTLGRRQGRIDEAFEFADLAVETAGSDGLSKPAAAYLEAWGRNIRAFLWMRKGDLSRAVADTETALAGLERIRDSLDDTPPEIRASWERDVLLSWGVLVHNRTALAHLEGDREGLERWRNLADELVDRFPELELFEVDSWLDFYREIARLDLALEKARRGVELARREQETLWEYRYLAQVADLEYRLGFTEQAVETCEEARRFRADHGNPDFLGPLHLLHASALGRLGRFAEARRIGSQMLERPGASASSRVEAHALLARLAAAQGDSEAAEHHANSAIEIALEQGHRDTLLRAAVAAGAASDRLGRETDAREAFERALEIADADQTGGPAPPAGDVLEALLGVQRQEPLEDEKVVRALRVLPAALKEPDTWWRLPALAGALQQTLSHHRSLVDSAELSESLNKLITAGAQRQDAAPLARQLGTLR